VFSLCGPVLFLKSRSAPPGGEVEFIKLRPAPPLIGNLSFRAPAILTCQFSTFCLTGSRAKTRMAQISHHRFYFSFVLSTFYRILLIRFLILAFQRVYEAEYFLGSCYCNIAFPHRSPYSFLSLQTYYCNYL
jgi:hypothetical protein